MKSSSFIIHGVAIAAGCICSAVADAQAVHTVLADFGMRPAGPNTPFTVNLTMNPADTDIAGFSFKVAYDNTQVHLVGATDNTGQPGAGAHYTVGAEEPLSGVPNVNVAAPVIMDTAHNLINPTNLGQLNFVTTAGYSNPQNRFWLHLEDHLGGGLINGNVEFIPTAYHNPESDPQLVPVSLSGFSLE